MQNARAMKALTLSSDPFPNLPKDKVGRLNLPILIITGENTIKIHKLVNEQLARLLSRAEQAIIPNAGDGSARDNPQAFNEAVLKFLTRHRHSAAASRRNQLMQGNSLGLKRSGTRLEISASSRLLTPCAWPFALSGSNKRVFTIQWLLLYNSNVAPEMGPQPA